MTGKGQIARNPNRRFRWMLAAQILWLTIVFALVGWWGWLLAEQAGRIAELESLLGVADSLRWKVTDRMIAWESVAFVFLLLLTTGILSWFYWRDTRRTRGLQAFFASVTHELKTPLTSIRLQAESISDSVDSHSSKKLMDRLLEDTGRLEAQVDRMLELARVEGGGGTFTQLIPLRQGIEQIVENAGYDQKVKLVIDVAHTHRVLADATALQVILRNLFENSIKHTGVENISVRLRSVQTPQSKSNLILEYEDNGTVAKESASTLGKLFHRGSKSKGAGVGLYLIRMLMNRMGGRVEYSSHPHFRAKLWFRAQPQPAPSLEPTLAEGLKG